MLMQAAIEARVPVRQFQSRNADEIVEFVGKAIAPHRMETRDPAALRAKLRCFEIAPLQIVDIEYGTHVWIDPGEIESHYLVHASLRGAATMTQGRAETVIGQDDLYVSSPGESLQCRMTPECRHLTVRIANTAFEEYLTRMLNISVTRPLVFYPGRDGDRELPVAWRNILAHIIQQIDMAPHLMGNAHTQKQYAMALIDMLLTNYCNNYSDQITLYGNDISPRYVRRARDIIHASLEETISVTDLAQQVGVSVRSLQNGFRQFLGLTPVEYVRRQRLEKLHRALMDNSSESSVTELMLDCGIVNFGRYAQYYRQQYSCRPSDTLRARRVI